MSKHAMDFQTNMEKKIVSEWIAQWMNPNKFYSDPLPLLIDVCIYIQYKKVIAIDGFLFLFFTFLHYHMPW